MVSSLARSALECGAKRRFGISKLTRSWALIQSGAARRTPRRFAQDLGDGGQFVSRITSCRDRRHTSHVHGITITAIGSDGTTPTQFPYQV